MTQSRREGVRVCVHDGEEVVYEKSVALPKEEVRGLLFVTLLGSTQPVQTPCLSIRELYWGIRVLGWLAVPNCPGEGNAHAPR